MSELISGNGVVQGPAKAVQMTPEQEAAAAAKLERARAARAKRKRAEAEGIAIAAEQIEQSPEVTVERQSPEDAPTPLPWQGDGEPIDFDRPADSPRLPDESKWPTDPETGARISPKLYAAKQQGQREREASERGDAEPAGKVAYLNTVASDDEYQAAKRAYDHAAANLRELEAEQTIFTGTMQRLIEQQDIASIGKLRARQRELPDLIFEARYATAQAGLAYSQLKAARERVAKQEARHQAHKALAELRELEAKTREIQYAVTDAETRSDDAVREVAAWHRQLDALKAEALAAAIGPQAHRAPTGMVEYGADTSYMRPMPQPGLERQ